VEETTKEGEKSGRDGKEVDEHKILRMIENELNRLRDPNFKPEEPESEEDKSDKDESAAEDSSPKNKASDSESEDSSPKKKASDSEEESNNSSPTPKKKKKGKSDSDEESDDSSPTPKKKNKKAESDSEEGSDDSSPTPKKKKKVESDSEDSSPVKKSNSSKNSDDGTEKASKRSDTEESGENQDQEVGKTEELTEEQKLQNDLASRESKIEEMKNLIKDLKLETKSQLNFESKLSSLEKAYTLRLEELKQKMKFVAAKIPMIIKEAKYNKKNYEDLNSLKKDKMKKMDTIRNKKEAVLLKAIQAKKKLEMKMKEFDSHQETLNDRIITSENTIKRLVKKEHQRKIKPGLKSLVDLHGGYRAKAKQQIETLEKKVEGLEKQLLSIQVKEKQKESDDDLDIEDDEAPQARASNLPDIRITKKKGKRMSTLALQETLRGIKEKDDEILRLKDEVRKAQLKVKSKDKEIFRLRN
jgi:hypothetical protein